MKWSSAWFPIRWPHIAVFEWEKRVATNHIFRWRQRVEERWKQCKIRANYECPACKTRNQIWILNILIAHKNYGTYYIVCPLPKQMKDISSISMQIKRLFVQICIVFGCVYVNWEISITTKILAKKKRLQFECRINFTAAEYLPEAFSMMKFKPKTPKLWKNTRHRKFLVFSLFRCRRRRNLDDRPDGMKKTQSATMKVVLTSFSTRNVWFYFTKVKKTRKTNTKNTTFNHVTLLSSNNCVLWLNEQFVFSFFSE